MMDRFLSRKVSLFGAGILMMLCFALACALPSHAFADSELDMGLAAQPSLTAQSVTHINYTLNQEYSGNLSGTSTSNATFFDFSINEKSHLHAVVTTTVTNYDLAFYNAVGDVVSAEANTIMSANSLGTNYVYSHSCDLDPGTYSLRVRSRYNTLHFNMITTAEPIITLNRASISSATSPSVGTARIAVAEIPGALGYEYKIAQSADFSDAETYESPSSTLTQSGLSVGTTYYAQVRPYAVYSDGVRVYGGWSQAKAVYVQAPTVGETSITSLTSPADETVKVDVAEVADAMGYQYQFAKTANFSGALTSEGLVNTFTRDDLDAGSSYYVRARAYALYDDDQRIYGDWSTAKTILVNPVSDAPATSPDGASESDAPATSPDGASESDAPATSSDATRTSDSLTTSPDTVSIPNVLTISPKSKSYKYKSLKKKSKSFKIKASDIAGAKLTYKFKSVPSKAKKYIKINKSTGKVTVKKGLKKGTYKISLKVSAAAHGSYSAVSKTQTLKIKVK